MSHVSLKLEKQGPRGNTSASSQGADALAMQKRSHAVLDAPVTYVVEDEEPLPLEATFVDLAQSTEHNNGGSSVNDVGVEWDNAGEDDFIDI